jgi:hypothetical protein
MWRAHRAQVATHVVVLYNVSQNNDNCVEVQGVYIEGRGAAATPKRKLYDKKYSLTSPRGINVGLNNIETEPNIGERLSWQTLGENVGELPCSWHMENMNLAQCNLLPNEMYINLNMLGPPMLYWIAGHVNS